MNITILSLRGPTTICDIRGGAREYIQEICKPWVKQGHKVNIVCGPEPKFNLYESENIDGINVIRVGKCKWAIIDIIKYYKKNLEKNTDVLIENMVSFPMYISLLTRDKKFYTIVHHLTDMNYFKTHKLPIAILGYFMEKITLRIFYRRKKFIAVSEYTKKNLELNGINGDDIDIINPGIREEFFEPGDKSEIPLLFYVGRYSGLGGNKKVDHLIDAFRIVQKEFKNAELIIAGKGDNIHILEEKAKNLNVKFIGMIDDEKKKRYMQKAWIFSSPSLAEGFGITWIEANACGTPVVGYKINGLNTVTEETSIMVEKENINELSLAMKRILSNHKLRKCMGEKGVENSKKYGWKKSSMKFMHIIKN
ncbi:MAG: glycosyltransferase family 4 protein [Paraclostridium sordellii]